MYLTPKRKSACSLLCSASSDIGRVTSASFSRSGSSRSRTSFVSMNALLIILKLYHIIGPKYIPFRIQNYLQWRESHGVRTWIKISRAAKMHERASQRLRKARPREYPMMKAVDFTSLESTFIIISSLPDFLFFKNPNIFPIDVLEVNLVDIIRSIFGRRCI